MVRRTPFALVVAALLTWAPQAFAETPSEDEEVEPPEPPREPGDGVTRAAAPDLRRGAILVSVGTGLFAPAYSTLPAVDLTTTLSSSVAFRGALGIGLSRHVSLEVLGSYGQLTAGDSCTTCSATSFSMGLGMTYHLAQGIAFDPWASFGVNYRTMTFIDPGRSVADGAGIYSGWDFAKIALGGTFYPTSLIGLGPYLEASFGGFRILPDTHANGALYAFVDFGLRVTLDPLRPGKLPTKQVALSY